MIWGTFLQSQVQCLFFSIRSCILFISCYNIVKFIRITERHEQGKSRDDEIVFVCLALFVFQRKGECIMYDVAIIGAGVIEIGRASCRERV